MTKYSNLLEAINGLKKEGYVEDFNLRQNCIDCRGQFQIFHDEFVIDKYFRFESQESYPGDQSIIYAISSPKYGVKGTLVNSYGIYSEPITDELLSKLEIRE